MNVIPTVIVATFTGIYVLGSFTVPYLTGPTAPNLLGPAMSNFFSAFNQPQQAEVLAIVVFVLALGIGAAYVWANVRTGKRAGATT
jgi:ABC-type spermidine/putrescine transport system permease subunit I